MAAILRELRELASATQLVVEDAPASYESGCRSPNVTTSGWSSTKSAQCARL